MNSFNHPAFGSVGDWLVSTVAGLQFDPECPGYQHILFKPRPGGTITWAEAKLRTPRGEAAIRWDLRDGGLDLLLTVPEGSRATLSLPEGWIASPATFAPGIHTVRAAARRSPVSHCRSRVTEGDEKAHPARGFQTR
jgi:alpha-L-rhamnosidase